MPKYPPHEIRRLSLAGAGLAGQQQRTAGVQRHVEGEQQFGGRPVAQRRLWVAAQERRRSASRQRLPVAGRVVDRRVRDRPRDQLER
jgi:hypothetical protein